MSAETDIKQQVREFYDQVGWQETGQGQYQNARYEDLRPVSREYIHRCHLRVARHLKPAGRFLLDAGSGPIQYPEYLEYSRGYAARVCLDISIVALKEARRRIGDRQSGGHGLFVVADIAHLPFKAQAFDGEVSLHTIHHLPQEEHTRAYRELYRVLAPDGAAVIVNGWDHPPLVDLISAPLRWRKRLALMLRRGLGRPVRLQANKAAKYGQRCEGEAFADKRGKLADAFGGGRTGEPKGTYVSKNNAAALKRTVGVSMPLEIWVWRSVSVRFLRGYIRPWLGGRWFLRLLFWLEERFPRFFGENGQYPLIVIRNSET